MSYGSGAEMTYSFGSIAVEPGAVMLKDQPQPMHGYALTVSLSPRGIAVENAFGLFTVVHRFAKVV